MPAADIGALCRPTVHDRLLIERVTALRSVTPATIRRAAKEVASEGFAGRAAGGAAGAALACERESLVVTNYQLLLLLVQQEEPRAVEATPPEEERPVEVERRAKRTIALIAPRLGQDAEAISDHLGQLAACFDPIGLGPQPNTARLPHAIACLKLLRQEAARLPVETDERAPALLQMLIATVDMTIGLAERAVSEARASAGQVTGLLQAWKREPLALSRQLTRADWLMDGWERIGQLWSLDPNPAARRAVLDEIAALLPVIPREVGEWVGFHLDVETVVHLRRLVFAHQDWRTGQCVQDTIARNEALLAA